MPESKITPLVEFKEFIKRNIVYSKGNCFTKQAYCSYQQKEGLYCSLFLTSKYRNERCETCGICLE